MDGKEFVIPTFESTNEVFLSEEEYAELPKAKEKKIGSVQLETVAQWTKGLRKEEMQVVIDNLPLDLLFEKIGKELEKNKRFIEAVTSAMDIVK